MRYSCSLLFLLLLGCTPEPPDPVTAFYHWQTQLTVTEGRLAQSAAARLYIKAFDIGWAANRAEPSALLQTDRTALPVEAVPVVFITNEVFTHPVPDLATNLLALLDEVFPFPYTEVQIDCDWTAGTRETYFAFLSTLQAASGKAISCTVRLHQYRDRAVQGIPPVDRVALMAYNTGNLDRWETENSILDTAVIGQYTKDQPPYPLPLDLAMAAYDWAVVYRRERLAYLINEPDLAELADTLRFQPLGPGRYRVDSSTYFGGLYLYRNDRIRHEVAGTATARSVAHNLWPRVANAESRYLIYYHIGSRQWHASR